MHPPRLGERLVAEGRLSPSDVERALGFQSATAPNVRLGSILMTWDLVDEESLLATLAALHRCEAVTGRMLASAPVDVVRTLSPAQAIRLNAIPYALERSRLRVAFVNPSDVRAVDETSALTGHACLPAIVTELRLLQAHRRFYGRVLPVELPPVQRRSDPARISRPEVAAPRLERTAVIPIQRPEEPPIVETEIPAITITIPDLPIPPRPTASTFAPSAPPPAAEAAPPTETPTESKSVAEEPEASGSELWLPHREDLPTSEAALGMWSPDASPPPLTDSKIGDIALSRVPPEFPRAILFISGREGLTAWRARGVDVRGMEEVRISSVESSVLAIVLQTGAPHFGRVDEDLWPQPLARLLGGPPPCAVFPVHFEDRVAALVYADRRGAPMRFEDTALLARAAAGIAALFDRDPPGEGKS